MTNDQSISNDGRLGEPARAPLRRARTWNIITENVSAIATALVAVVSSREIVNALGEEGYGIWSLMGSLLGFAGLVAGGLAPAIVRYVSKFVGTGRLEDVVSVAKTARNLVRYLSLAVVLYGGAVYLILPSSFGIPDSFASSARTAWILFALASVVDLLGRCSAALLSGLQRHDLKNYIKTGAIVIQMVAIVAAMRAGFGLEVLAAIKLFVLLASLALFNFVGAHVFPQLKQWKTAKPFDVGAILRFSRATFIIYLAANMVYSLDSVIIGAVLGVASVAMYAPAVRIMESPRMIGYAALNVLIPRATELHERGETEELNRLVQRGSRATLAMTGPILAAGIAMGDRLLVAWLGPGFESAFLVMMSLLPAEFVLAGTGVLASTLIATGHAGALARIEVTLAAINVALSVWACSWIGLIGPAISTSLTGAIGGLIFQSRLCRTRLGIPFLPIWANMVRALLALSVTTFLMMWLARPFVEGSGLVSLILKSVPFVLTGYVVFGLFVLTREDRERIRNWLLSLL